MADPLSAVGFAGNLIQLIDLSLSAIEDFLTVQSSPRGPEWIQKHGRELQNIQKRLKSVRSYSNDLPQIAQAFDDRLPDVVANINTAVDDLLQLIERLSPERNAFSSRFSFAVKANFRRDELQILSERFHDLRTRLTIVL
jgi:hypothetical protein